MSTTRQAAISRSNSRAAQDDRERLRGMPGTKRCPRCGASKPLSAFYPHRTRGTCAYCIPCDAIRSGEYGRSKHGKSAIRDYCSRPEVKARRAAACRKYRATAKGAAVERKLRGSAREKLVKARYGARRRLAQSGSPKTAETLRLIEAEIARIDRRRDDAA